MSQSTDEILIDHLDNILSGKESSDTADRIRSDKELNKEWQTILLAIEGIREAAVTEKANSIYKQYQSQRSSESSIAGGRSLIRSLSRIAVRVAACLLLLIGAVAVYKYSTVNSNVVFEEHYSSYELSTSRGSADAGELESLYRAKNWQGIINLNSPATLRTAKSEFLTGMANMELKNYSAAITHFNEVFQINAKNSDNFFQDEAEYYAALALLASKQTDQAKVLMNKMKADGNHSYHQQAEAISASDLKILDLKSDN